MAPSAVSLPSSVATGTEPVFLALDPTGTYSYEANYTVDVSSAPGTVSEYAIGTDGTLTLIGTEAAGLNAFMIATAY
jgi:hypothetical protein